MNWLLLGLLSHSAWGCYPVLARYLQNTHRIGTMSLSAMTNTMASLVIIVFMAPRIRLRAISVKETAILIFIIVARGLSNLYASRFTFATTVQLLSLLAPFIVAYLSKTLFREPLPQRTGLALLLSLLGSVLMIAGAMHGTTGFGAATASDWIGIGLAIFSGIMFAFYMLFIKHTGGRGASAETMAFIQFASLSVFMTSGSLLVGEDWSPWISLPPSGIAAYLAFVFGVLLLGTILQNHSLRHLGASMYSTIQAWRLIGTITFSWLLLGERITTLWQVAGAIIVMATVTWYMLLQKSGWAKV
jgi:drug/metabolite transporter (DMT)-like permease